jgi:hypothetical protein
LVTFAGLLRHSARNEDFVARYGGEEFVVLCSDCDKATATTRAEEIRHAVENTPIPSLGHQSMTSSFGVTEIQEGDTEATFLARADRALLMAKEGGRNRVIQLGMGLEASSAKPRNSGDAYCSTELQLNSFRNENPLVERGYLASTTQAVATQRLSGFISEHSAEVLSASESAVAIRIDGIKCEGVRRLGERAAMLVLEVRIQGVQVIAAGRTSSYQNQAILTVSARPLKARDRRTTLLMGQINQVLRSFQTYMFAQEIDENLRATIIQPR